MGKKSGTRIFSSRCPGNVAARTLAPHGHAARAERNHSGRCVEGGPSFRLSLADCGGKPVLNRAYHGLEPRPSGSRIGAAHVAQHVAARPSCRTCPESTSVQRVSRVQGTRSSASEVQKTRPFLALQERRPTLASRESPPSGRRQRPVENPVDPSFEHRGRLSPPIGMKDDKTVRLRPAPGSGPAPAHPGCSCARARAPPARVEPFLVQIVEDDFVAE